MGGRLSRSRGKIKPSPSGPKCGRNGGGPDWSDPEVIEEMFAEGQRHDPRHESTWWMLVDGLEAQRRQVEAAMARHRKEVVLIQDFVHVLEYLWKAANRPRDNHENTSEKSHTQGQMAIVEKQFE